MESMAGTTDWRDHLEPDFRVKIVQEVIGQLKNKMLPTTATKFHIHDLALKFEEKMYQIATSKADYFSRLSRKLDQLGNMRHQNIAAWPTNQGRTQTSGVETVGYSSSLQYAPEVSVGSVGNTVGQGKLSNITSTNSEIQLLNRVFDQPHQQQQLQNQTLMHNLPQQNLYPSLIQPNIHNNHQPQTQLQIVSQPRQFQLSQQPILPIQPHQQLPWQQPYATLIQQNEERSVSEQQNISLCQQNISLSQQNMSNSFEKPLGLVSNGVGVQHLGKMADTQSNVLNLQPQQNLTPIFQQAEVTVSQKRVILQQTEVKVLQPKFNQTSQPVQMLLDSENKSSSCKEGTQQRLQTSTMLQSRNVYQQKQLHSERILPEVAPASVKTMTPTDLVQVADWHDEAYSEVQSLKEEYLPDVKFFLDMSRKDMADENFKLLNNIMKFFQMSRSDIARCDKVKFDYCKVWFIQYLRSEMEAIYWKHAQLLQPSDDQSQLYQLQQNRNERSQFQNTDLSRSTPSVYAANVAINSHQQNSTAFPVHLQKQLENHQMFHPQNL